jgi:hypothetical protein
MTIERRAILPAADEPVSTAYRTMMRATGFLGLPRDEGVRDGSRHSRRGRARYHGNVLRELDRFLNLLLDACAPLLACDGHDGRTYARLRNAAKKLAMLRGVGGSGPARGDRLLAIGRVRDCLHHCAGRVHDAGLWNDLAIAGEHLPIHGAPPASHLALSREDVLRIAQVYAGIAQDLRAAIVARGFFIDFPPPSAHLREANVACDRI